MKLKIEEPCNEDWDKMKIGLNSRHCEVCVKEVVDFTKMSRAEILMYMVSKPTGSVCGRMTKDQFDFRHQDIPILIETLKVQRPSNSFLILALVCSTLSACAQEQTIDNTKHIKVPSVIEHSMGKVAPVTDSSKVENASVADSTKIKTSAPDCTIDPNSLIEVGEIEMQGEVEIMGDMIMEESPIETAEDRVFQFAEKMPEYKGGVEEMMKLISKNLKFPNYEKTNNIQGNVYARFIVNKDGSISDIVILKSVEGSKNFDKEVKRVINMMPKWSPGENLGKKVRAYMTLPFQFKIR